MENNPEVVIKKGCQRQVAPRWSCFFYRKTWKYGLIFGLVLSCAGSLFKVQLVVQVRGEPSCGPCVSPGHADAVGEG